MESTSKNGPHSSPLTFWGWETWQGLWQPNDRRGHILNLAHEVPTYTGHVPRASFLCLMLLVKTLLKVISGHLINIISILWVIRMNGLCYMLSQCVPLYHVPSVQINSCGYVKEEECASHSADKMLLWMRISFGWDMKLASFLPITDDCLGAS